MKYKVTDFESIESLRRYVTVELSVDDYKTFPADKSNSDYVQFLEMAQLTDAKVKKLDPNVWYDFPEPLPVEPIVEEEV